MKTVQAKWKPINVKCSCGNQAAIAFKEKHGTYGENIIKVNNVPIYACECGKDSIIDSDYIKYVHRFQDAVEYGIDEVDFYTNYESVVGR